MLFPSFLVFVRLVAFVVEELDFRGGEDAVIDTDIVEGAVEKSGSDFAKFENVGIDAGGGSDDDMAPTCVNGGGGGSVDINSR